MPTPTRYSAAGALFALVVMVDSSFSRALFQPECGTILGHVELPRGQQLSGVRVSIGSGETIAADETNRLGDFQLKVPGPGEQLLIATRATSDSAVVKELSPHRAYTMMIDVQEQESTPLRIERVTIAPRSCAGPPP